MKINQSAVEYLNEKSIKEVYIYPKTLINFYGCSCVGGTRTDVTPEIRLEGDGDDFTSFEQDGITVKVKNSIIEAIDDDSELKYSNGLFSKGLSLKNFYEERITKSTLI